MKTYNLRLAMTPKEEMLELDSRAEKNERSICRNARSLFCNYAKSYCTETRKAKYTIKVYWGIIYE